MKRFTRTLFIGLIAFAVTLSFMAPVMAADMPYGLKAGMPYKGTKLTFLVHNAAQSQAQAKRVAKFTEMTGIEVQFLMVPYPSLREKITADAVAGGRGERYVLEKERAVGVVEPKILYDEFEGRVSRVFHKASVGRQIA